MEHLLRVQRAIDYIEENLREELSIEKIAKVACFSMWHFQRIFCATVGEPCKEYVRKRRLSRALVELQTTERRILDIAVDYGFESQESFTRAFKAMYLKSPGQCRKDVSTAFSPLSKPRMTLEYLDYLHGGFVMEPKFVSLESFFVVGVGAPFICISSPEKNNDVVIPALWESFLSGAKEVEYKRGAKHVGVCEAITLPATKRHPDEFFYTAGVEVTRLENIPKGMIAKEILAGKYAVFTHKGKLEKLQHTIDYIYSSWLSRSGNELRDAPDLEVYDDRFKPDSDESEFDLYIPIR